MRHAHTAHETLANIKTHENFVLYGISSKHFCCPYILVYVIASNTASHFLFTSHLFGTRCDFVN